MQSGGTISAGIASKLDTIGRAWGGGAGIFGPKQKDAVLAEAVRPRCDVLIVEDDPMQADEMAGFLGRAGLVVVTAYDGANAIRLGEALQPHLAVLDYNLPDMTGANVAERLRSLSPDTAIIMMSGRIDGLSKQVLRELGVSIFLNKPVPMAALRQAVQELVRASPAERDASRNAKD